MNCRSPGPQLARGSAHLAVSADEEHTLARVDPQAAKAASLGPAVVPGKEAAGIGKQRAARAAQAAAMVRPAGGWLEARRAAIQAVTVPLSPRPTTPGAASCMCGVHPRRMGCNGAQPDSLEHHCLQQGHVEAAASEIGRRAAKRWQRGGLRLTVRAPQDPCQRRGRPGRQEGLSAWGRDSSTGTNYVAFVRLCSPHMPRIGFAACAMNCLPLTAALQLSKAFL